MLHWKHKHPLNQNKTTHVHSNHCKEHTFKPPNTDTKQKQACFLLWDKQTLLQEWNNRDCKIKIKCKSIAAVVIRLLNTSVGAAIKIAKGTSDFLDIDIWNSKATNEQDQRWRRPRLRLVWEGTWNRSIRLIDLHTVQIWLSQFLHCYTEETPLKIFL